MVTHHGSPIFSPSGLAVALKQALQPEFKDYGNKVIANARAMSRAFVEKGYSIATGQFDMKCFQNDTSVHM